MKSLKRSQFYYFIFLFCTLLVINCSSEDSGGSDDTVITPSLVATTTNINFENTAINASSLRSFSLVGSNLNSEIILTSTSDFSLSLNGTDYSNTLTIALENANSTNTVSVKFSPQSIDDFTGSINVQSSGITNNISIQLSGTGTTITNNFKTFNKERVAFGGGFTQTSVKTFDLPSDISNVEFIKMYVQLTCPSGGCDEWDVFANVKVTDPISGERFEMARFITPYWNDNSQLPRGFEFDVTDFKSLLSGSVELRIRTECWNARGYEVSIDFDYIEGTPDYQYYEITRILNYDNGSAAGIPYGIAHDKDLTKTITIPSNSKSTHLRTIIGGWGEASPADTNGRPCAEWCFRTHSVKINGAAMFQHEMGPLGCASNPVNNQSPGNWMPDRAGWCPGMELPTRINDLPNTVAGSSFNYEYELQSWVSDGTKDAYYPISSFVVVKSDTPITRPQVMD